MAAVFVFFPPLYYQYPEGGMAYNKCLMYMLVLNEWANLPMFLDPWQEWGHFASFPCIMEQKVKAEETLEFICSNLSPNIEKFEDLCSYWVAEINLMQKTDIPRATSVHTTFQKEALGMNWKNRSFVLG